MPNTNDNTQQAKSLSYVKSWLFPSLAAIIQLLVLMLFNEMRSDIKDMKDDLSEIKKDKAVIETKAFYLDDKVNTNKRNIERLEQSLDVLRDQVVVNKASSAKK